MDEEEWADHRLPSSDSTEEPKYLPTPTYRHIAPPLLKIQFSGGGQNRERVGWASGRVSCEDQERGVKFRGGGPRALEGGLSRAERRGCRRRANARTVGGGHRLLPHLAALLVMKADHHDVQDRPPWGAIAAPPDLHGRTPRARTTMTSTAEGGKLGDPAIPRRTARGGFQVSAREPHEGRARDREEADDPAALHRPPGPRPRFPHPLPLFPGCHLMPGPPRARRDWAGPGGT